VSVAAVEERVVDAEPRGLRADSLSESVLILLALTLVQPAVGFVRGVLFCRWLDSEQLGQWDVALGFLTLVAPLIVLGIPGSFGRYVEYYRRRGQLRSFLRTATLATISLTSAASVVLCGGAGFFSRLLFGGPGQAGFVWSLALALGPLVAFGFVTELLNAFRLYRVVSGLQLFRSTSFLLFGALFLFAVRLEAISILAAYALASLATAAIGGYWICRAWSDAASDGQEPGRPSIWLKVLPFALWVWTSNNLTNLFEVADRYLLVHFSGLPTKAALELVGNYHSSRIVPLLIAVFASMLASILLPHLSHAWETGRRGDVDAHLKLALKLFGFALSAGSAVFLGVAPLLFQITLQGKYQAGLSVLPGTLISCIWFGQAVIATMYLWCREEARLGSIALFVGLAVNVVLNLVLLPTWGLLGAVVASSAARLTLLLGVLAFGRLLGLRIDCGSWVAVALPLALLLGPAPALLTYGAIGLGSLASPWLLCADDKRRLWEVVSVYARRIQQLRANRSLATN
jgi:O-antigen/teichoic acid export membrane protein